MSQSRLRVIRSEQSKRRFCIEIFTSEIVQPKHSPATAGKRGILGVHLQNAIVRVGEIGREAQPQLSNGTMHLSECLDSFRCRRTVDLKRCSSSSGEEEADA